MRDAESTAKRGQKKRHRSYLHGFLGLTKGEISAEELVNASYFLSFAWACVQQRVSRYKCGARLIGEFFLVVEFLYDSIVNSTMRNHSETCRHHSQAGCRYPRKENCSHRLTSRGEKKKDEEKEKRKCGGQENNVMCMFLLQS